MTLNEQQLQELIEAARNGVSVDDLTSTPTVPPLTTSNVDGAHQQQSSTRNVDDDDEFATELAESNRGLDALLAACNEVGLSLSSTEVDAQPVDATAPSTVTTVTATVISKQTPMMNVMIPVDDRSLSSAQYAALVMEAIGGRTAKVFAKLREENEERKRMFKEAAANYTKLTVLNNRECEEKVKEEKRAHSRTRRAARSRKRRFQALVNEIPSDTDSDSSADSDFDEVEQVPRAPTPRTKKTVNWPTRVTTCNAPRSDGAKCLWVECGHGNLRYHISHFHDCEFDRAFFNDKKIMTQAEWDDRWAKWKKQSESTKNERKNAAINNMIARKK